MVEVTKERIKRICPRETAIMHTRKSNKKLKTKDRTTPPPPKKKSVARGAPKEIAYSEFILDTRICTIGIRITTYQASFDLSTKFVQHKVCLIDQINDNHSKGCRSSSYKSTLLIFCW